MNTSNKALHRLFAHYQVSNQRAMIEVAKMVDGPGATPFNQQVVFPPEPWDEPGVPTLKGGVFRPFTEMLRARFEFASEWREAHAGHHWLSLSQMRDAVEDTAILNRIESCAKCWDTSPPATHPPDRVSLFGVYFEQGEEIYLLWPDMNGEEPEVVSYAGNYEERFKNLEEYLRVLIAGADLT